MWRCEAAKCECLGGDVLVTNTTLPRRQGIAVVVPFAKLGCHLPHRSIFFLSVPSPLHGTSANMRSNSSFRSPAVRRFDFCLNTSATLQPKEAHSTSGGVGCEAYARERLSWIVGDKTARAGQALDLVYEHVTSPFVHIVRDHDTSYV